MRLSSQIGSSVNSIIEKSKKTFISQEEKEEILERIYENNSFYKMTKTNKSNWINVSHNFNLIFKDIGKSLSSVK